VVNSGGSVEQQSSVGKFVRFATFDLDLQSGELRKNGRKIRLPHQSFQVLARLLVRPGEVVSRDALRQILWPGGTFVDFEVGLSSAVKKLRDALGDSAENPRFVETVPRFGYRFIAPVNGSGESAGVSTPVSLAPPVTPARNGFPTIPTHAFSRRGVRAGVALTVLAVVVVAAVFTFRSRNRIFGFAPSPIQSLAVLPLENLTGDPGQDYFADGLTDALTTTLAETTDLRVSPRSSTAGYKTVKKPLSQIGRELDVDGIVEGAFVRSRNHVRVSVQLIDARSEQQLWARNFDQQVDDIVALQEDVARAVTQATVGESTRHQPARQVSAEAEDLFFRAVAAAGRENYQGFVDAIKYADAATNKQPDFARAWATKAIWLVQFSFGGGVAPREFMPRAEAAAKTAIGLDDSIPGAHEALAMVLYRYYWNWSEAERELQRSLQLNATGANAHRIRGAFLAARGNLKEAVEETQRARDLDPVSVQARFNLAKAHREAGQTELAISEYLELLHDHPEVPRTHQQLGMSLLTKGDWKGAVEQLQAAVDLSHRGSSFLGYLGYGHAIMGHEAQAQEILRELDGRSLREFVSPVALAGIQVGLGLTDAAMASLEKACDVRDPDVVALRADSRMDLVRSDPRFKAILRRVGLPN